MSGVAIARYLLANNAAMIAAVPAARIFAGNVIGGVYPAVAVTSITGVPRNTVAMTETSRMITERVQVTVYAGTYALQKQLLGLVRGALPNTHGTVNTVFNCDSILPDNEGPDIFDDVLVIYEQGQDFMVKFNR
jgi:hypothetical protein